MQRTTIARVLAIGALAWAGIFIGAGVANAQSPEPTPAPSAAPAVAPAAESSTQAAQPAASTPAPQVQEAPAAAPKQAPAPAPAAAKPAQTGGGTVQNGNTSAGAGAASGAAATTNNAVVGAGPRANGGFGGQASQIGNNNVTVVQSSKVKSGDAIAGSQVTGVTGGGNTVVQNSNASFGAVAVSGPAVSSNTAVVNAGPSSSGGIGSGAQQIGSNRVEVIQSNAAESGAAVAGSQVTGIVGGSSVVQNQNSSFLPVAISGAAIGSNLAFVNAGPVALGGQASQVGSNDAVLHQVQDVQSGDAVAGSQVTGIVGGRGTVQNSGFALFPVAVSGPAISANVGIAGAGPVSASIFGQASQVGSNDVAAIQDTNVKSGDAVAGSQVTGLVSQELGNISVQNQQSSFAPIAISGGAANFSVLAANGGPQVLGLGAQASQLGSNRVVAAQLTDVESGDAIAGSQVTGSVGGGRTTVQNSNTSFAPVAFSGPAVGVTVGTANAGPQVFGLGFASASQTGNNTSVFDQHTRIESGDAVAGGQVTGIVGGLGARIQNSNTAIAPLAVSGPAFGFNAGTSGAGPSTVGAFASASQTGNNRSVLDQEVEIASGDAVAGGQVSGIVGGFNNTVQNQNFSIGARSFSGVALGFNQGSSVGGPSALGVFAQASQFGSNSSVLGQIADTSSGDAIAGSQVVGIAGGFGARVQGSNTSFLDVAVSAIAAGFNTASGGAGPAVTALGGPASASQFGSNRGNLFQATPTASGDAVAGSEVFGIA